MSKTDKLKKELWDDEAEIAIRIVEWFNLLRKLRHAAGRGVATNKLIEQLLRADPDLIDHDYTWLMILLRKRFELGNAKLNAVRPKKITDEKFSQAVEDARDGTKVAVAKELKCSVKTLNRYLDENPGKSLKKQK